MSYRILGTCSQCGGHVVTPRVWAGIAPHSPQCIQCGATPKTAPVTPPRKVRP